MINWTLIGTVFIVISISILMTVGVCSLHQYCLKRAGKKALKKLEQDQIISGYQYKYYNIRDK